MPVKLNVGVCRKVGEANFGSRGASINLEAELDASIVSDQHRFKERVRSLYAMARRSVNEELNITSDESDAESTSPPPSSEPSSRNGDAASNRTGVTPATASQVRAIYAIARKRRLKMQDLLRDRFGADHPEALSIRDASTVIDELKQSLLEPVA
jgi:hypothetical protein